MLRIFVTDFYHVLIDPRAISVNGTLLSINEPGQKSWGRVKVGTHSILLSPLQNTMLNRVLRGILRKAIFSF